MSMTSSMPARPGISGRSWSRRLGAALEAWWAARMAQRLESLAIRQLQAMSDRELRDIGVSRSHIEWAVRSDRNRDRALIRRF